MDVNGKSSVLRGALVATVCLLLSIPTNSLAKGEDAFGLLNKSWMVYDKTYWPTEPVRGGYVRSASTTWIGLLNPNHYPVNDWVALGHFYDKLFEYGGDYKPNVPWVATSYKYLDQKTVVLELRKGIQFSDGTPLNAESVKFQMDWIMDRKSGCWTRGWLSQVESIEEVGDYTLKWRFKKPWASFAGIVASTPGYTLSMKALKGDMAVAEIKKLETRLKTADKKAAKAEKKAEKLASKGGKKAKKANAKAKKAGKKVVQLRKRLEKARILAKGHKPTDVYPVGTGRYTLVEAKPNNYLKVKRNPNWWFSKVVGKDMPYFDGRIVYTIPDRSVQLANLRAGKIDFMSVPPEMYIQVKNDPRLNVYVFPEAHTFGMTFNHAKGPCRDIRIRKAISHAIDRKALIHGLWFGLVRLSSFIYPGDHYAHNPDLKPVPYDPELSRKLLAEAGYAKGLTLRGHGPADITAVAASTAVKDMLAKVGIEWNFNRLDPVAMSDRARNLEYDMAWGGWTYIFDPDTVATGLYHPDGGFNYGRSNNAEAIALIEAGRKEFDFEKRIELYQQLEKVLYDNYEDAWIFWATVVTAYRKNVQGVNVDLRVKGGESYRHTHLNWFKEGKP
ncbi:MAG: ABC transporter substrate-binding protein [Proteobacteria bacterium]|nr:ABC transporter substrate-binding protein [Pseudomonadota bacterium]